MSKYNVKVTVNYPDGAEKEIECNPESLYNLKKVVAQIVTHAPEASSFVFVVCETHKTGE